MMSSDTGFSYLEDTPVERFRVPDQTNQALACAALLAFAAYPLAKQRASRQRASDAFCAWIIRAAMEEGVKIKPPPRLTRAQLPPAMMRRRVYMASKRFETDGLSLVGLGMDMTFFRSGGPADLAGLLGSYFGAKSVSVTVPAKTDTDAGFLESHLRALKSKQALEQDHTLHDFRRRVWKVYLPALPLLTAIHVDCLKFNAHKRRYDSVIPGHPQRYLAISLLRNPSLWLESVVLNTCIRRALMVDHFPPNTFAEILGEQPLPTWVQKL